MDFLVISGASLTYIYSLSVLFGVDGDSYFDSVAMIITFVLVGKYLEVIGKKSAVDIMDNIRSKMPMEVTLIRDNSKVITSVDSIEVGDIVEVKRGERVGVDGVLLSSSGLFDESSLSGESIPIEKEVGDKLYSGTLNVGEVVRFKVISDYANSTVSNIVNLLEDALNQNKYWNRTNELSKYFSISILNTCNFKASAAGLYSHLTLTLSDCGNLWLHSLSCAWVWVNLIGSLKLGGIPLGPKKGGSI